MEIQLEKKPSRPVIIEGFPGFGLVGTIATEFLIEHTYAERIGRLESKKIPAIIAVHKGKIIEPFEIFYSKKYNIVILRAVAIISGFEWELADSVLELCNKLKAKELISIEGVGAELDRGPKVFYLTKDKEKQKKFESCGIKPLREGIVFGATASLLSKAKNSSFIFAEAHSELPDSRAAAKIIEALDKYLGLKVDYKPLIEKAEVFEKRLKELLVKSATQVKEKAKREAIYVG